MIGRRKVDLIGVHDSGQDILLTVFFDRKPIRFGVELFCKFVTAVFFEIDRVDIEYHFVEKRGVGFQSSARDLASRFLLTQNIHIRFFARIFEVNVERNPRRLNIDVSVVAVFPLVVSLNIRNVSRFVALHPCAALIFFFRCQRHTSFPVISAEPSVTPFSECV